MLIDGRLLIKYERHKKKKWGGTLIAKVIIYYMRREASSVEQYTIGYDYF